jgi:hypothetical protein
MAGRREIRTAIPKASVTAIPKASVTAIRTAWAREIPKASVTAIRTAWARETSTAWARASVRGELASARGSGRGEAQMAGR